MNEELSVVATGDTSGAQKSLKDLQSELGKTAVAATKTDSSLDVVGKQAKDTAKDIQGLSQGAGQAATAMENIGASLPTGGFLALAGVLFEVGKKLYDFITSESELEKTQRELNTAINQGKASVASQVVELTALVEVGRNAALSTGERQRAIDEINKKYPEYLGYLTTENINTKAVTESLKQQVKALEDVAAKKAISKLVDNTAEQLAATRQKFLEDRSGGYFHSKAAAEDLIQMKVLTDRLNTYTEALAKNVQEEARAKPNTGRLKQIDDEIAFLKNQKELHASTLAETKDFNAKIKKLQDERDAIDPSNKKAKAGRTSKEDNPFTVSIQDLEDNYKDAQALDVGIKDYLLRDEKVFLEKKKALLEKYGKYEGENNLAIAKNAEKIHQEQLKFIASQQIPNSLPETGPLSTTQKIQPKIKIFPSDEIIKEKEAMDALAQQMEATGQILEKTLLPAFDALFTSIIDGSNRSGQSFIKMLNQVIKQLEKTILKALALAAIESIFGGPTFGTAFDKALGLSNVFGGHASGTSNFEGGLTWVGEHGKELVSLPRGSTITPAAQLSGMGNDRIFIPSLAFRGADMIVAFNRATAQAGRNG